MRGKTDNAASANIKTMGGLLSVIVRQTTLILVVLYPGASRAGFANKTPGKCTLRTHIPGGERNQGAIPAKRDRAAVLSVILHLFESSLAAQADLAGVVNVDDFDRDIIAFGADVGDFGNAVICHFGDVEQSVHTGKDLNESTEVTDGDDFTAVDLADFSFSGAGNDAIFGSIELFEIGSHDLDGTVFFDIDGSFGIFGDGTDIFTAGTDKGTDLVRIDFDHIDARSAGADVGAGFRDTGFHDIEDLEAGDAVAFHTFTEQIDGDAGELEVELESGDTFAGTANLEVHIAEVVFGTDDVGKQQTFAVVTGHQTAGDTGDRSGDGDTGIHQRQSCTADGSHGCRTVGAHDFRDTADDIGKILGNDLGNRAFRQIAVTDFAASGTGDAADFTDAEVGEVVVQIEAFVGDAFGTGDIFDLLGILFVTQSGDDQSLGFAAGEKRTAVNHRKHVDFSGERTDIGDTAAVGTELFGQDDAAGDITDVIIETDSGHKAVFLIREFCKVFAESFAHFGTESIHGNTAILFTGDDTDIFDASGAEIFHSLLESFRNLVEFVIFFGTAGDLCQFDLGFALFDDGGIGGVHGIAHFRFGEEFSFTFDHDDLTGTAGVDEFEAASFHLFDGGVDDILAVDLTDADRTDGTVERQIGEHQRN